MIVVRIVFSFFLLVLGLMMPWWIFIPLLAVGALVFPYYIEGIVIAGLYDAAFAGSGYFSYLYTSIAVVIVVGMYYLRRFVSFV